MINQEKIKNEIPANVHIIHFRNPNSQKGGITVAYRWSTSWNGGIHYGIAFCSKKDMFNKKEGVRLALNRLDSNHMFAGTTIISNEDIISIGASEAARDKMAYLLVNEYDKETVNAGL